MAINMTTARKLCTRSELELVLESSPAQISGLTPANLRTRIRRARTLRDKYKTLASRQRRIARGKQEKRGARPSKSNENTVKKQQIFDETLARFEKKLAVRERAEAKAAATERKKAAKKSGKKTAQKTSRKKRARIGTAEGQHGEHGESATSLLRRRQRTPAALRDGVMTRTGVRARNTSLLTRSESTKGKRVERTQQQTNRPAIRGHVSSRGRRRQARRDSR